MSDWDVICVGAGSAGLPLAIRAAERGAKVLQLEADGRIGGTLHYTAGQFSAAGTRLQKSLGIDDSPDEHFADAQRIAHGTIDPLVLRLCVDNAAAMVDWLEDIGFTFAPGMPVAGEAHEAYRTRRYQWGTSMGLSILETLRPLHDKLIAAGKIDLRLKHRMRSLMTDASGTALGVRVEGPDGKELEFRGRNIVLTTGGYAAGPDVWKELTPQFPLCSYASPMARGDGIVAAKAMGAQVGYGENYLTTFAGVLNDESNPCSGGFLGLSPKSRTIWEIFVDANGKRFMREDHPSIDYRERQLLRQPGTAMSVVFDEGILQNAPPFAAPPGSSPSAGLRAKLGNHPRFLKADTLDELAAKLGVPAANLKKTVADYNAAVDAQSDPEFGRQFLIRRIEKAPFYAIRAQGITVVSPAGLAVNDRLQVLKGDGVAIPNLYAAGEILGMGRTSGNAFVGGLSLTPALTFGKMLGERLLSW